MVCVEVRIAGNAVVVATLVMVDAGPVTVVAVPVTVWVAIELVVEADCVLLVVVDEEDEVDEVDEVVVVATAYWNVVVEVAPEESVAVMTYVPVTHNGVPPT
jgi:hypothetical protein